MGNPYNAAGTVQSAEAVTDMMCYTVVLDSVWFEERCYAEYRKEGKLRYVSAAPDAEGDDYTSAEGTGLENYKTAAHAFGCYPGRGMFLLQGNPL